MYIHNGTIGLHGVSNLDRRHSAQRSAKKTLIGTMYPHTEADWGDGVSATCTVDPIVR